jgi:hypothetical protein
VSGRAAPRALFAPPLSCCAVFIAFLYMVGTPSPPLIGAAFALLAARSALRFGAHPPRAPRLKGPPAAARVAGPPPLSPTTFARPPVHATWDGAHPRARVHMAMPRAAAQPRLRPSARLQHQQPNTPHDPRRACRPWRWQPPAGQQQPWRPACKRRNTLLLRLRRLRGQPDLWGREARGRGQAGAQPHDARARRGSAAGAPIARSSP